MNGFLKYSERVMSATKRTDTDNTDDLRVSEMDRLVETGFCYRVVPDGLVALDLGVDVFAEMDRPLGEGDSFGSGLVFRLRW